MQDVVVGIDLGGTHARAGAITPQGQMLALAEDEIQAGRGFEAGLDTLVGLVQAVLSTNNEDGVQRHLIGVGVGSTGPVDPVKGVINNPFTLPTWVNVPIVAHLQERFGVPVILENDGDVAALGEYWLGAGKGIDRLYAITVGTGVGAAYILDGRIHRGANGFHPEGGHLLVDPVGPLCYCGMQGCLESLVAGPAIKRRASELTGTAHEASAVIDAARRGEDWAIQITMEVGKHLARGLVTIVMLFQPHMIVLSGGVMRSYDLFKPAVEELMAKVSGGVPASQVRIELAHLGYYAGIYGAAYTILSHGEV